MKDKIIGGLFTLMVLLSIFSLYGSLRAVNLAARNEQVLGQVVNYLNAQSAVTKDENKTPATVK